MSFRFGLLGASHVHTDGLTRTMLSAPDRYRLVAAHDPDPALLRDRVARWNEAGGEVRACASVEELLASSIDGIALEGEVDANVPMAIRAVEAGHPVLLEKPAGIDLPRFDELLTKARERRRHVQMLYLFRWMSAVQAMIQWAREGNGGDLYLFRGRLPKEHDLYGSLEKELGRYAGGVFFEMAGHLVDLAVTLLGRPIAVTPFMRHHSTRPGRFIDHGVAVLEFDRAQAILDVSCLEVAPSSRRIELFGAGGAFVIPHLGSGHLKNDATQTIQWVMAGQSEWTRADLPAARLHERDLSEFVECARGLKAPEFTPEHDRAVHSTLLSACGVAR